MKSRFCKIAIASLFSGCVRPDNEGMKVIFHQWDQQFLPWVNAGTLMMMMMGMRMTMIDGGDNIFCNDIMGALQILFGEFFL